MIEVNKIYNEDCITGMGRLLKENGEFIDAIITDPPYNISMKNNFQTMGRAGIEFGEWDKNFDIIGWIKPALSILKKGGNIIIFNDWKNMSYIKDELESNGCLIKEMLMWKKTNPMPRNRDRLYVTSCEFAIWATKGKGWTFNRQRNTYENGIFEYSIVNSKQRIHPTQKPLDVMKDLIQIHSNKNDIIFDPFMGSASTALACMDTDRNYIGFELDKGYYNLANKRIQDHLKDLHSVS